MVLNCPLQSPLLLHSRLMVWSRRRLVGAAVAAALIVVAVTSVLILRGSLTRTLQDLDPSLRYTRLGLRLPAGLRLDQLETDIAGGASADLVRAGIRLFRLGAGSRGEAEALRLLDVRALEFRVRPGLAIAVERIRLRRRAGGTWDLRITGAAITLDPSASAEQGGSIVPRDASGDAHSTAFPEEPTEPTLLALWEDALARVRQIAGGVPATRVRMDEVPILTQEGAASADLSAELWPDGSLALNAEIAALPLQPLLGVVDGGLAYAAMEAALDPVGGLQAGVTLRFPGLILSHPRLADEPIGPMDLRYGFSLALDPNAPVPEALLARRIPGTSDPAPPGAGHPADSGLRGSLHLRDGELVINGVPLELDLSLRGLNTEHGVLPFPGPARVDFSAALPSWDLQNLVDAVPQGLLGPLSGVEVDGSLSWRIRGEAPLQALSWTRWEEETELSGFALLAVPPEMDVRLLSGSLERALPPSDGSDPRVVIGPPTAVQMSERFGIAEIRYPELDAIAGDPGRFVPLEDIAPAMLGAVITTEDSEFLTHSGVNWQSLMFAAEVNLAAGEIVSGGSTIPMQLAKNLYLDQSRILSRKLQELGLVALMNQATDVSRARLLEVYLNVIEFGPGIYGIREASDFYFGVHPRDLSVEQSVWLASIIRSPRRFWIHARDGEVPEPWLQELANFLRIMYVRGRISAQEYKRAAGVQPEFALQTEGEEEEEE